MQDYGSRGAGPGASDLGASESAGTGTGNDSMGLNDSRRQGGAASPPPGRDHGGVRAGESDRLADDARGEGATPGVGDPANAGRNFVEGGGPSGTTGSGGLGGHASGGGRSEGS